jgi:hypothetical protein
MPTGMYIGYSINVNEYCGGFVIVNAYQCYISIL